MPGSADLEELLQVLVEFLLGHALPPRCWPGAIAARRSRSASDQASRSATLVAVSLAEPAVDPVAVRSLAPRAQVRIITAALDLFAEHGVNGTSLQMIADAIGVTKAAVYHQFKTKDEIVLAAVEVDLAKLEAALDAAEAEPRPADGLANWCSPR